MLEECTEKSQLIVEVGKKVGWSKLWDSVMDLGPKHVRGLQNLSRMFSGHGRGNRPCPLCDEELEGLLAKHIIYGGAPRETEIGNDAWNHDGEAETGRLELCMCFSWLVCTSAKLCISELQLVLHFERSHMNF